MSRIGRPPKDPEDCKTKRLEMKLTPRQWAKLEEAAKKLDTDKSTLLRDRAFKQIEIEFGGNLLNKFAS